MRQVTITEQEAEEIARTVRGIARRLYAEGRFSLFARGMVHGQLTMFRIYMRPQFWILQGIENEIAYLCRRACEEQQ